MFVPACRGPPTFVAFPPFFPVLRIYHFNFSFFEANINNFLPSLVWFSDLPALNPINPCHGRWFILTRSFHVAIPSQPLTLQVFSYIFYYLSNCFILTHSFHVAIPSQPLMLQVFSYIFYYLFNIFISDFPETYSLEYTQQGASLQAEISMCIQRPKYAQSYFLRVALYGITPTIRHLCKKLQP